MAVLFTPLSKPKETPQIKVSYPWVYPGIQASNKPSTSLAIFHGNENDWLSKHTYGHALIDTEGALETPSFELLTSSKNDSEYLIHSANLPYPTPPLMT
jgi:hypothetical protein